MSNHKNYQKLDVEDDEMKRIDLEIQDLTKNAPSSKSSLWLVFLFSLNIFSSVGIVMINKWIFEHHNFKFGTILALLHFVSMFIVLRISGHYKWIQVRSDIKLFSIFPLVASFIGFVVLTNLSLRYNSVGIYQCAKIMSTPVTAILQFFIWGTRVSKKIVGSMIIVCMGVGIATVTDLNMNFIGTCFACAATITTSFYYILVGQSQKDLSLSPLQLLYAKSPYAAIGMLLLVPVFDDVKAFMEYNWTNEAIRDIVISCLLALLLNFSTFITVGKTSALAFSIVGHLKTAGVFLFGFLIFKVVVTDKNILGIAITMFGVVLYSYLKLINA